MTAYPGHDPHSAAHRVFAGLTPSRRDAEPEKNAQPTRLAKSLQNTVPIVLAGSMAVTLGLTSPIEPAAAKRPVKARASASELGKQLREAIATASAAVRPGSISTGVISTAAAPASYRVAAGDTVSSIAGRFGLSTASVLALNGLGWKSVIFPGQVLKLGGGAPSAAPSAPAPATNPGRYTIQRGDTISSIAARFGVSTQALLTANGLGWSSIIYPGQSIGVPTAAPAALQSSPVAAVTPIAAPPAGPTPRSAGGSHVIQSGDTLTSIARTFGVTVQAILDANGLGRSSIIYAGRSLTIPAAPMRQDGSTVTPLTDEMRGNARLIASIGRELGVSEQGIVIALAAAMQESSLRNIDYGDRDSIGLFQQRPSAGWGTRERILDANHATRLFYGGRGNPNAGVTRGLLDIPGWESMTVTQAAQAVQISAFPDAYAKWERSARAWLAEL